MSYENFDIEDFATDDSFIRWVINKDEESKDFWKDFLDKNPDQKDKIAQARKLVLNLQKAEHLVDDQTQVEELWKRIEHKLEPNPSSRRFSYLGIAATISLLLLAFAAIGYFSGSFNSSRQVVSTQSPEQNFIEEVNTGGKVLKIYLSDGSSVCLNNNSRLRYRKDFAGQPNREVFLTGEALFDVAKNPAQPFLVRTNELTTKVLGTRFIVTAYEGDKDIVVAVKEGKVSVFSAQQDKQKEETRNVNGVVLTPNQKVVYTRSEDSFNKTLVEEPKKINEVAENENFKFDNEPVKNVFASLEKAYGVEIIFDEEVMGNCFLTVPLGDEPLYEKMNIICRTVSASYELIDASIVVTSKGCP